MAFLIECNIITHLFVTDYKTFLFINIINGINVYVTDGMI